MLMKGGTCYYYTKCVVVYMQCCMIQELEVFLCLKVSCGTGIVLWKMKCCGVQEELWCTGSVVWNRKWCVIQELEVFLSLEVSYGTGIVLV